MEKLSIFKKWLRRHPRGLFWCAYGLLALAIIFSNKWIIVCAILVALMLEGASVDDYTDYDDE